MKGISEPGTKQNPLTGAPLSDGRIANPALERVKFASQSHTALEMVPTASLIGSLSSRLSREPIRGPTEVLRVLFRVCARLRFRLPVQILSRCSRT